MENNKTPETMNKIILCGELVKNNLDVKDVNTDKESIAGDLVLRTPDGSEHSANFFTYRYKKDSQTKQFTNEENKMYETYIKVMEDYKGIDKLAEGEKPVVVSLGAVSLTDNDFVGNDGNMVSTNKISAKFANIVEADKIETTKQEAKFQLTGIISKMVDESKAGVLTGNKLITLDVIGYNGKLIPVVVTVLQDLVNGFMSAGFYEGVGAKLAGNIVNTSESYMEEQSFGEPIERTRTIKRLEVTGGSPIQDLNQLAKGFTMDFYNSCKEKRKLKLQEVMAKHNGEDTSATTGFTGASGFGNPNPTANPFLNA